MSTQKRIVFLIVRPAWDYEESSTNFFACESRKDAEEIIAEVMTYMARLHRRLPLYPGDDVPDADGTLHFAVSERREALIKRARWPYGIDLHTDLPGGYEKVGAPRDLLEIRHLAVLPTRRMKP